MEGPNKWMLHQVVVQVAVGYLRTEGPQDHMLCQILLLTTLPVLTLDTSAPVLLIVLQALKCLLLELKVNGGYRLILLKLSDIGDDMRLLDGGLKHTLPLNA